MVITETHASYTDGALEQVILLFASPFILLFSLYDFSKKEWSNQEGSKNKSLTTKISSLDKTNFKSIIEFSKLKDIPETKIIEIIRNGFYNGTLINNEWYIHNNEFK